MITRIVPLGDQCISFVIRDERPEDRRGMTSAMSLISEIVVFHYG